MFKRKKNKENFGLFLLSVRGTNTISKLWEVYENVLRYVELCDRGTKTF